jgi:hypothetical protein
VVLAIALGVVVSGGYSAVSRVALVLALLLVATTVVAAARVFRPDGDPRASVVPGLRVPDHIDVPFLLPWIGTILAGSMGIVWFSYWTARRGYGGGVGASQHGDRYDGPAFSAGQRDDRLVSWFRTLSHTATIGVLTGTVVITSFLVLGAELLGPGEVATLTSQQPQLSVQEPVRVAPASIDRLLRFKDGSGRGSGLRRSWESAPGRPSAPRAAPRAPGSAPRTQDLSRAP